MFCSEMNFMYFFWRTRQLLSTWYQITIFTAFGSPCINFIIYYLNWYIIFNLKTVFFCEYSLLSLILLGWVNICHKISNKWTCLLLCCQEEGYSQTHLFLFGFLSWSQEHMIIKLCFLWMGIYIGKHIYI